MTTVFHSCVSFLPACLSTQEFVLRIWIRRTNSTKFVGLVHGLEREILRISVRTTLCVFQYANELAIGLEKLTHKTTMMRRHYYTQWNKNNKRIWANKNSNNIISVLWPMCWANDLINNALSIMLLIIVLSDNCLLDKIISTGGVRAWITSTTW